MDPYNFNSQIFISAFLLFWHILVNSIEILHLFDVVVGRRVPVLEVLSST